MISFGAFGARFFILICLIALITASTVQAQDDMITITVREGQSLREIAETYLQNPNLWTEILRSNDLTSAADVRPGMRLLIPANAVSRANQQMERSLELIEEATMNGARLFAPSIIENAFSVREQAQGARNSGEWQACYGFASHSADLAQQALDICLENQSVPAQAIVNYREGVVQARDPDSRAWQGAPLHHVLLEGDRIRTLSESVAGIMFRDESRLRLEQNSLALIQRMRYNMLENTEQSSVSLLEGDLFAFLGGGREGDNFQLEMEDVQTDVNSGAFFVSRDDDATRFANYEGELSVTSGDETVVLAENMGSVVRRGHRPTVVRQLLPRPKLMSPGVFARVHGNSILLEWEEIDDARTYWLEIAHDKSFSDMVVNDRRRRQTTFAMEELPRELYYWRVSAIDEYGLPGPKSEVRLIAVLDDVIPPYLLVMNPRSTAIVNESMIMLQGETEQGADITLQGQSITVSDDGTFETLLRLTQGMNEFTVEALDGAGNSTTQEMSITYIPDAAGPAVEYDTTLAQVEPNVFMIQEGGFTLSGITQRDNRVCITGISSGYRATTIANENGLFQLSVPVGDERESFNLREVTPTGQITEEEFSVQVKQSRPVIVLDSPLPQVTGEETITVSGSVRDGDLLSVNGESVQLGESGSFATEVALHQGANSIRLEARDLVRNVTLIEREIVVDSEPPEVIRVDISDRTASGGDRLTISVYARDSSEMARAAQFTLEVASFVYEGYMVLDKADNAYRTQVTLPDHVSGRVQVRSIVLEDYYGNNREYRY